MLALQPPAAGSLEIGDTVKISYVDQNRAGLDPNKNLWEAVSDGNDFIEVGGVEIPTRAYVASFGFKGSDQQKLTGVLSGGERNRLNLALTLKQGGNLLLLDEPIASLDVSIQAGVINLLEDLQAQLKIAYLFVAHDLAVIRHISDRVCVMYHGVIVEQGETEDVFTNPQHPYTKALLSAIPIPDPVIERSRERYVFEDGELHKVESYGTAQGLRA